MPWRKSFLSPTAKSAPHPRGTQILYGMPVPAALSPGCDSAKKRGQPARADRRSRGWVAAILAVMLMSSTATLLPAVTSACQGSPGDQIFQVNRREAKKLLLSTTQPSYPPLARINYIGGRVRLLITVDCQGRVQAIHVLRGHPFLAIAALDAIHRWVYRPFQTKTGPASFQTLVDVNFSLVGPDTTGLTKFPPQPEKFLDRSVVPPQLLRPPGRTESNATARLRVLVSRKGRVVDVTPLSGSKAQLATARKEVMHWRFRPARWGNMNVPWYLEVDVPTSAGRS
jgi:TonB family protein